MIQANELRIGNLVKSGKGIYKVAGIHVPNEFICQSLDGFIIDVPCIYKPISITQEWLLNFGFKKALNGYWCTKDLINVKISKHKVVEIYLTGSDTDLAFSGIQYVHQLQNLYFALTQKELEYVE
jgi:hypothetical protein